MGRFGCNDGGYYNDSNGVRCRDGGYGRRHANDSFGARRNDVVAKKREVYYEKENVYKSRDDAACANRRCDAADGYNDEYDRYSNRNGGHRGGCDGYGYGRNWDDCGDCGDRYIRRGNFCGNPSANLCRNLGYRSAYRSF